MIPTSTALICPVTNKVLVTSSRNIFKIHRKAVTVTFRDSCRFVWHTFTYNKSTCVFKTQMNISLLLNIADHNYYTYFMYNN